MTEKHDDDNALRLSELLGELEEARYLLKTARAKLMDWGNMYSTWLVKHPNALPPARHVELLEDIEEFLKKHGLNKLV